MRRPTQGCDLRQVLALARMYRNLVASRPSTNSTKLSPIARPASVTAVKLARAHPIPLSESRYVLCAANWSATGLGTAG